MNHSNLLEYKVVEEMVAAFVEAVDSKAFVLADIADVMGRVFNLFLYKRLSQKILFAKNSA